MLRLVLLSLSTFIFPYFLHTPLFLKGYRYKFIFIFNWHCPVVRYPIIFSPSTTPCLVLSVGRLLFATKMRSNINRTVYLPILFLIIFGFSPVGTSSTTSTINISHRDETAHNTEPLNCTTELSPEFYGFGVRLGVYFAWLSQYFANILLPSEIASSLDTNSIFLLALLAGLFRGTIVHELFQIDGLILMHLSSGFLFSSLSIWGYRTSLYQKEGPTAINYFGRVGTHCRLALATAISLYGAWFWWEGLRNGLNIAEDPQCRIVFTWFFKQWPVTGGIHTFYIFISIGCAVYYGTMCIAAVLVVIFKRFQGGWKRKTKLQTGFTAFEYVITNAQCLIICC